MSLKDQRCLPPRGQFFGAIMCDKTLCVIMTRGFVRQLLSFCWFMNDKYLFLNRHLSWPVLLLRLLHPLKRQQTMPGCAVCWLILEPKLFEIRLMPSMHQEIYTQFWRQRSPPYNLSEQRGLSIQHNGGSFSLPSLTQYRHIHSILLY